MSRLAVATIVAKSHLSLARVLAGSFKEYHPDVPFFVLLADEIDGCFKPEEEPFELIGLQDLPVPHPERFYFNYTRQELSYACTPYLLEALLERGFTTAVFLKQESLVLDDFYAILEEAGRSTITLTPHLLEPLTGKDAAGRELNILQSGIFNVGFLGVSESTEARRFLAWWRDRVYRHCRHDVPGGMHYEQRWLDLAPVFFKDVRLVRDPGFNLGHWNLPERKVRGRTGDFTAGGSRLRFMRFSGFDPERPGAITRYHKRLGMKDIGPAAELFHLYARLLAEAGFDETSHWPYAYGRFDKGTVIPAVARQIYREMGREAETFADPFRSTGSESFFNWLRRPAEQETTGTPVLQTAVDRGAVSNLWQGVYKRRPDVQAAFPDYTGSDKRAFLEWAECYGIKEHGIPEDFHPGGRGQDV